MNEVFNVNLISWFISYENCNRRHNACKEVGIKSPIVLLMASLSHSLNTCEHTYLAEMVSNALSGISTHKST